MDEGPGWARAPRSAPRRWRRRARAHALGGGCRPGASGRPCCACSEARTSTGLAGLGVTAAEVSGWRDAFLAAGEVAVKLAG